VALAQAGAMRGRVLDVGCGTGEHALLAAGSGLDATGIDVVAVPIEAARAKAAVRGLGARFLVWNALDLATLGEQFDTVLDSGCFHILEDRDRPIFVKNLHAVIKPGGRYYMLAFSDRQPGDAGPRRVTQAEIRSCFAVGWRVDAIEPAQFELEGPMNGAVCWLASISRL
jgi:cyclopropane fatty-acyl-phospholipid synthase-like methyltransferase